MPLEAMPRPGRTDYSSWTFEELRALAVQLRIAGAERKTHRDLLELLSDPRPEATCPQPSSSLAASRAPKPSVSLSG